MLKLFVSSIYSDLLQKSNLILYAGFLNAMFLLNSISNYSILIISLDILLAGLSILFLGNRKNRDGLTDYLSLLKKNSHKLLILMIFLVVIPAATLLYSANPLYGFQKVAHLLVSFFPMLFFSGYGFLNFSHKTLISVIKISISFGMLFSILAIITTPFDPGSIYSFSFNRWSHVISGRYFTVLLVLAIWYILHSDNNSRSNIFYAAFIVLGGYVLYQTTFRAGIVWVSLFVPIISVYHLSTQKARRTQILRLIIPLLVLIAVIIVFPINSDVKMNRLDALARLEDFNNIREHSIETRLMGYESALSMLSENLFSGVGFGGFKSYYSNEVNETISYPHNLFLEIFAKLGVIYGLIFCCFMFLTGVKLIKFKEAGPLLLFLTLLWLSQLSKNISSNAALYVLIFWTFIKMKNPVFLKNRA